MIRTVDTDGIGALSNAAISAAGQQEILNWCCLAGAVEAAGLEPSWTELVESWLCNSNKCFAVFGAPP
jgi:hypothetical protein